MEVLLMTPDTQLQKCLKQMPVAVWLAMLATAQAVPWDATQDLLDASRKGDIVAVKAALESQAGLESKTRYGQTPLFLAAMNGHVEVVQLLLDKGANVDVTDTFYKSTAIGFAATRKHTAVVKILLARSKDADRNLDTVTGLRNPELVAAVLAAGKPSQVALDRNFELASGNADIAGLLSKAGAKPPAPGVEVEFKVLESYAGTFRSDALPLEIKVSAKEGKLYLQASGQPEFAPKAKSPTVFEFAPARLEVEFSAPDAFVLKQGGQNFNFKKVVAQ
jgi:Ankyrin repeats (3 copies)